MDEMKEVGIAKVEYYNDLRKRYYDLIEFGNSHPSECIDNLQKLRQLILLEGLPPETEVFKYFIHFKNIIHPSSLFPRFPSSTSLPFHCSIQCILSLHVIGRQSHFFDFFIL